MDIGQKRERITVERRTETVASDPFGNYILIGDTFAVGTASPYREPYRNKLTHGTVVADYSVANASYSFTVGGTFADKIADNPTATGMIVDIGFTDIFYGFQTTAQMLVHYQEPIDECAAAGIALMFVSDVPVRGSGLWTIDKEDVALQFQAAMQSAAASSASIYYADVAAALEDPAKPLYMGAAFYNTQPDRLTLAGANAYAAVINAVMESAVVGNQYGDINEETWSTYIERWAKVIPLRGREYLGQDKIKSEVTHRIFTRYDTETAAIREDDRIVWRGQVLDIVSVLDIDGRKQELEIMATEREV